MNTAIYHHQHTHEINFKPFDVLGKLFYLSVDKISKLPWLATLLLLLPFGLIYTTILYFPLRQVRRMYQKSFSYILSHMDDEHERSLMILHAQLERITPHLQSLINKLQQ